LYHTLNSTPPAPRSLKPAIPPELERICRKAMGRRPEDRYPTCQELADDLRQWLDGPPSPPLPTPRRSRRRRVVPAAAPALLLFVPMGLAGWFAWGFHDDTRRARDEACQARAETDLARYRRLVGLAGQEWLANNAVRADELLDACPEQPRGWEWHYLKN